LNDGDLANVDRVGAGGEASRAADPACSRLIEPQRVEQAAARIAVDALRFATREIA
jgi:hypothetical protein